MIEYKKDIYEYLKKKQKPCHYVKIANYLIKKHNINPMVYYKSKKSRFKENLRNMMYEDDNLILLAEQREDWQGYGNGFFYFKNAYENEQQTLTKNPIKKRNYYEDVKKIKKGLL